MTSLQDVINRGDSFTPGQNNRVFIGTPYALSEAIPYQEMTLVTGAVAANATSLTLTQGSPVDLHERTLLGFKADWAGQGLSTAYQNYFVVSEFTAAGATQIPIEATPETAAGDEIIRVYAQIPYLSANTANIDNQVEIIEDRVFGEFFTKKQAVSESAALDASGVWIHDDPGFLAIRAVSGEGKLVTVMVTFDGNRGGTYGSAVIGQNGLNSGISEFVQATMNFDISGKPITLKSQVA
ncbi:hypothetical protein [Crocosphaera sp.]|uniref:hypothetical protein n=1 Tax=Crocosphaera sp. TaxID=2729996 RepID=UPI00262D5CC0|nr:hypothetical protein [Crocosphaera sp.]MDJ0579077.1 hypothetical protein [Crocosphaera sp.]